MDFTCKHFDTLSTAELFEIYKLRSQVFVVEQNCVYQDVDSKDLSALHVMGKDQGELVAYSRILPPGLSYDDPSIGRVVVKKESRLHGAGRKLMNYCMNKALESFKDQTITISAQTYLRKFYTSLGFKSEGEDYLEDGIPHIRMRYSRP